jgi:hypothetical protein
MRRGTLVLILSLSQHETKLVKIMSIPFTVSYSFCCKKINWDGKLRARHSWNSRLLARLAAHKRTRYVMSI